MPTDDTDAGALRERVRELEATVSEQQATIERLMPSRRGVLAGAAAAAGLGAAGLQYASYPASAQAAGQVGTSADPNDVFAWNLDVQNGASFNNSDVTGVGALDVGTLENGGVTVKEIDASPISESNVGSISVSVPGDSYKFYQVRIFTLYAESGPEAVRLRYNGYSGSDYNIITQGGSITNDASEFVLATGTGEFSQIGGTLELRGDVKGRTGPVANLTQENLMEVLESGYIGGQTISDSLSSLEFSAASGNISAEMVVKGITW